MTTLIQTVGGSNFPLGMPGQIADGVPARTQDYVNSASGAIDFGRVVVRDTNDNTCKVLAAVDTDQILGISVRHFAKVSASDGTVSYNQYDTVPVLKSGLIWCTAAEDTRRGDQALVLATGTIGSSKGGAATTGRVAFPGQNAVWEDTVTAGSVGRVRINIAGSARTTT